MGKRGIIIRVVITLLFLVSLYFVEAGFCGSSVIAKYNDGFGTVDMKSYDVKTVQNAVSPMNEKGIAVYKLYYLMDFIFVLCFGAFQLMLINDVYSFERSTFITFIICSVTCGFTILSLILSIANDSKLIVDFILYMK